MVVQFGSVNTAALNVPGVLVQIVPPPPIINGLQTNILGIVGIGSWGPTNSPFIAGDLRAAVSAFGQPQNRKYDLVTAAWVAGLQGANNFRLVRVTDGTDVAASAVITATGTALTLSAKYTGSLGNQVQAIIAAGSQANTYKMTVTLPGYVPEVFDNIAQGITAGTVTAGTGYTSVPSVVISAPQAAGGVQAAGSVSLKVLSANVSGGGAAAGTGYVTADTVTLANGVVLTVTASSGAITGLAVASAGSLTGGSIPTNPTAPTSTSGSGTGALINLVWGLGTFTATTKGSGYTSATATLTGGGGSGGSIALIATYWGNLADAINNGQSGLRGPSQLVTAVAGVGTGAPAAATTSLSGGTDGASAVSASTLLGVDTTPRKGMYALRNTGTSVAFLADADDSTSWAAQVAFGLSEGVYMQLVGPAGDTISNAVAVKSAAGIDSYDSKLLFGDWLYFNDTINNSIRLVSPQGFVAGRLANLSPEQSSLNKQIYGVVSSQKTNAQQVYSQAELSQLAVAGIDVIGNPSPGGSYFGAAMGHNTSSNYAIHGDNYTRMTNFLAYTFNAALGIFVGRLQSQRADDKFRRELASTVSNFLQTLVQQGMVDDFQVQCDLSNNPSARIAAGYCQVDIKVRYLAVVEYLIANLEGGQTVSIQRVSVQPA